MGPRRTSARGRERDDELKGLTLLWCMRISDRTKAGLERARNPCAGLEVVRPRGVVFATDDVPYYGTNSFMCTGEVTDANFAVGRSRFEAKPQAAPAYWVLPLASFLTECRQAHPDLDASRFSGHSMRAGLPTSASAQKVGMEAWMPHTRHKSVKVAMRYARRGTLFVNNPAAQVGL